MLIVFCGRPGTGKTTLARALAGRLGAAYVRIDTIENAMLADGGQSIVAAGGAYHVALAVTADILGGGMAVVADAVNAMAATRDAWRAVAGAAGVATFEVLVMCTDPAEHRRRIEARPAGGRGSNWREITGRQFDPVARPDIVVDTADSNVEACLDALQTAIGGRSRLRSCD